MSSNPESFAGENTDRHFSSLHNHTEWANRGTEKYAMEKIDAILDSDEALQTALHVKARRMARTTARHFMNGEWQTEAREIDAACFQELYDETLPTLTIDVRTCFRGSELTGQAAQMLRTIGESSINIVFACPDTRGISLVLAEDEEDSQSAIKITHGIMIDANGNTYSGAFPKPVYSRTVETNNAWFMDQCQEHGINTLNDLAYYEIFEYKENIGAIANDAGINSPRTYTGIPTFSSHLYKHSDKIVAKPTRHSGGGKGISLHETGHLSTSPPGPIPNDKIYSYDHPFFTTFLADRGYEPRFEECIESLQLFDIESGEPLEWTVRYTIADQDVVGVYVRVNNSQELTNVAQGGAIWSLEDLHEFLEASEYHAQGVADQVISRILEDGKKLSVAIPSGMAGVDTVMNQDLESYLLEINIEQFSGMQRLTDFAPLASKHEPHQRLINAWRKRLCTDTVNVQEEQITQEEQIERDMTTIFKGLYDTGNVNLFAELTKEDTDKTFRDFFIKWLWIQTRFKVHIENSGSKEEAEAIVNDALTTTPMTFLEQFDSIVRAHHAPEYFHHVAIELAVNFPEALKTLKFVESTMYNNMQNRYSTPTK